MKKIIEWLVKKNLMKCPYCKQWDEKKYETPWEVAPKNVIIRCKSCRQYRECSSISFGNESIIWRFKKKVLMAGEDFIFVDRNNHVSLYRKDKIDLPEKWYKDPSIQYGRMNENGRFEKLEVYEK